MDYSACNEKIRAARSCVLPVLICFKKTVFRCLLLDIRFFETESFFLIHNFKNQANGKCCNSKSCKHHKRCGVVELCRIGDTLVGGGENLAYKQREKPQTYVLNPENKSVCRTDDLCIDEFWHAWPK